MCGVRELASFHRYRQVHGLSVDGPGSSPSRLVLRSEMCEDLLHDHLELSHPVVHGHHLLLWHLGWLRGMFPLFL